MNNLDNKADATSSEQHASILAWEMTMSANQASRAARSGGEEVHKQAYQAHARAQEMHSQAAQLHSKVGNSEDAFSHESSAKQHERMAVQHFRCLAHGGKVPISPPKSPILTIKRPLVLLADDVPANLQMLGTILQEEDIEIAMASSGAETLEIAKASPPNLILLDIMMPDINGYEVCRQLKSDPRFSVIPIIFITALSETDNVVKGFEAGCVDYVTKPFRPLELKMRVRTQSHLHQLRSLLPICMYCNKIREDDGSWDRVDHYISRHAGVAFSHGICPECAMTM